MTVQPVKTMWVFGDSLIDTVAPHIEKLIDQASEDLYITKNYEITCFTTEHKTGYYSNNFLVRIINTFITALNTGKYLLPHSIVIMLHNSFLKDPYFGEREMPKLIEKLIVTLQDTIRQRKKQVEYPYFTDNQPRIILLRPVPKPAFSLLNVDQYKNTRRKFANDLEEITHHYRVQLVNLDELNCSQRVLFNEFGNLSDYGIEKFWRSLSDHFRRNDRDEYNAVKLFRVHKKSVSVQTYTQPKITTPNKPPTSAQPQIQADKHGQLGQQAIAAQPFPHSQMWPNNPGNQQPYQQAAGDYHSPMVNYHNHSQRGYPTNDRYHVNRK